MGGANLKLFIVTRSSELLLAEILRTPTSERIVIASAQLSDPFTKLGISIIPIVSRSSTTAERDKSFNEIAMPGVLDGINIDTTSLPAWKVLGIDRLRFWYYPHNDITSILDMINFDELIVSFDLHNPVIWQAVEHVGKATAVKTSSILDRQHMDFLRWYNKISLVVSHEQERQFLLKNKIKKVVSAGLDVPTRPRPTELRKKTIGMYYDSRFDWKALVMFQSIELGDKKLVIGFPNNTEWRKFMKTFPQLAQHEQIELQDAIGLHNCEEVLLPTYDENLVRQFPENVKITYYDIANTEKASFFSGVLQ
jgi:hypothetical protein